MSPGLAFYLGLAQTQLQNQEKCHIQRPSSPLNYVPVRKSWERIIVIFQAIQKTIFYIAIVYSFRFLPIYVKCSTHSETGTRSKVSIQDELLLYPEKCITYRYLSAIFLWIHLQPWRAFDEHTTIPAMSFYSSTCNTQPRTYTKELK